MANKLPYRADIDGLRAVAVLAVIASHLPEKFLPSGFLGVDVFFAISGFVVTASLLGQRRTKLPDLYAGFLARRIKRLLPALIICVAVTSAVVIATDPFPKHSIKAGIAALFGVSNIALFIFKLDYFSPSSVFNAFTHTWSLGVEEQFYVVFPMFTWLFYFWRQQASFRHLITAMIVGGFISLGVFVVLYEVNKAVAFFMMPARIWELGVGALVFLAARQATSTPWQRRLVPFAPLALVLLVVCFFAPEDHALPATIAAVALTGLLLAVGDRAPSARLLTLQPVVYVGKISYSLYLWHWPVIALGPIVLASVWRSSAVYVVVMALAAVASFHLVEKPLRYASWSSSRLRDIGIGVTANVVVGTLLFSFLVAASANRQTSVDALHPPAYLPLIPGGQSHVLHCALDGGNRVFKPDTVETCTVPPAPGSGSQTIWAMGDSHSGHLQGMLYELHDRLGLGVHLVETPGWSFPFPAGREFAPRTRVWESIVPKFREGDIVMVSRLFMSRSPPHPIEELRPWLYLTSRLADELARTGVRLIITGPPPIFPFDDIRECSLAERDSCRLARNDIAPQIDTVMNLLTTFAADHSNVVIFNVFDAVCPPDEQFCYPDNGISFQYRDKDHFNSLGARQLAEPFAELLRSSNMVAPAR